MPHHDCRQSADDVNKRGLDVTAASRSEGGINKQGRERQGERARGKHNSSGVAHEERSVHARKTKDTREMLEDKESRPQKTGAAAVIQGRWYIGGT